MKFLIGAVIAVVILTGFLAEGVSESMKNLEVKLGFGQFPAEYTCDGKDVSPKIEISGLNATSIVMILDDLDAPSGAFTHWLIWNIEPVDIIPADIPKTMNVTKPIKAVQGINTGGTIGYGGPCPPPGRPHRYFLKVYGLDRMLDLKPGSKRADLERAMQGHIVQQGQAMVTYGR